MAIGAAGNVLWIDGLRGIASVIVLATHLSRAWDYDLFFPVSKPETHPRILQLPFLRIPWQGRIGVAIFAFLTGYVCALKPIKQSRAGNHEAALSSIAKSAFRRGPRLIIPASIAACIAWTLGQLGGFTVANRADSEWLRYSSPELDPTLWMEIKRLYWSLVDVWVTGRMDYDDHQWSLLPLLKGSMLVYVVMSGTVYCKAKYRMVATLLLCAYFYHCKEETFTMQSFFGMFMSDLSNHPTAQDFIVKRRYLRTIVSPILIIFGLFIASYPKERPEWAGWSNIMLILSGYLFPYGADIPKFWTALGLDFVILGVHLSPIAKDVLSGKWLLWLGKHSFAVYLIHGTLLRTVLVWMVYGITGQPWKETVNEKGEKIAPHWLPVRGGRGMLLFWIPIWVALVYFLAHLWMTYVDTWSARMTFKLEKHCFVDTPQNEKLPVHERRGLSMSGISMNGNGFSKSPGAGMSNGVIGMSGTPA